jgi:hypothetical protein
LTGDDSLRIAEPALRDDLAIEFKREASMVLRLLHASLVVISLAVMVESSKATTVTIHTEDARATLKAMQDHSLTKEEAIKIATMHGNQAVIRKLQEFKIPATAQTFADALYSAAHDQAARGQAEQAIGLDHMKPKIASLVALLDQIQANPRDFEQPIEQRIAMFTPSNANIRLDGYVVASGDGGGYAFGDTDFFLNIGIVDDLVVAKSTTVHEMYHAIQGFYASDRESKINPPGGSSRTSCLNVEHLFGNLYEEGSARYVEDFALMSQSHSPAAKQMLSDIEDGISRVEAGATLLDMSVVSLTARQSLPYDDVYAVGFLGHGLLYGIGYVMAKAVVESEGREGLISSLRQPPHVFVLRYIQLPKYGADRDHPRLEPNTIEAAHRLEHLCE